MSNFRYIFKDQRVLVFNLDPYLPSWNPTNKSMKKYQILNLKLYIWWGMNLKNVYLKPSKQILKHYFLLTFIQTINIWHVIVPADQRVLIKRTSKQAFNTLFYQTIILLHVKISADVINRIPFSNRHPRSKNKTYHLLINLYYKINSFVIQNSNRTSNQNPSRHH